MGDFCSPSGTFGPMHHFRIQKSDQGRLRVAALRVICAASSHLSPCTPANTPLRPPGKKKKSKLIVDTLQMSDPAK